MKIAKFTAAILAISMCLSVYVYAEEPVVMEEIIAVETPADPIMDYENEVTYLNTYDAAQEALHSGELSYGYKVTDEYIESLAAVLEETTGYANGFAEYPANDSMNEDNGSVPSISNERKYYSDFYYDHLNKNQQNFWNAIEQACYNFYTAEDNIDLSSSVFATFRYDDYDITHEEAVQTQACFGCSHPEYFFFGNGYAWSDTTFSILCHKDLWSHNERVAAKEHIEQLTDRWFNEIEKLPTETEKEIYIAQLLADNIIYEKSVTGMDQSMCGGFFYGRCVCNGYALAFEYMCNGAGLECILVGTNGHAWNRVRIDGVWYESDATWYDQQTSYFDSMLNRSTASFEKQSSEGMHTANDNLRKPTYFELPECNIDMKTDCKEFGAYPADTFVRLEWPEIDGAEYYHVMYAKENGGYTAVGSFYSTSTDLRNLTNDIEYDIYVIGYDSNKQQVGKTNTLKVTPRALPSVTGLTAKAGTESAELSWNKVDGAAKYYIYLLIDGKFQRAYSTVETGLKISGLNGETTYTYSVRPCFEKLLESSEYSASVSVTPASRIYKITAAANDAAGGTVTAGISSAKAGTKFTASAAENNGYIFNHWSVEGSLAELSDPYKPTTDVIVGKSDTKVIANFYKRIDANVTTTSSSATVTYKAAEGAVLYRISRINSEEDYLKNILGGFFVKNAPAKATFGNRETGATEYYAVFGYDENDRVIAKSDLFKRIIRDTIPAEATITETGAIHVEWENVAEASAYNVLFYRSVKDYEADRHFSGISKKEKGPVTIGVNTRPVFHLAVVGYDADGNIVNKSDLITLIPEETRISSPEGVNYVLSVPLNGRIEWQKKSGSSWTTLDCTGTDMTFSKVSESGEYRCIVTGSDGAVSADVKIIMTIVPYDEVTKDMLRNLSDKDIIDFVNSFTDKTDMVITEGQLYAIERVLAYDKITA